MALGDLGGMPLASRCTRIRILVATSAPDSMRSSTAISASVNTSRTLPSASWYSSNPDRVPGSTASSGLTHSIAGSISSRVTAVSWRLKAS